MRSSARWRCVWLLLVCLLAAPALAHDEEAAEREIAQHKQQMQELMELAQKLEADGRQDEARELISKVERMEQALQAALRRKGERSERGHDIERLMEIRAGVRHGMEALEALAGHRELIEHLAKICAELEHRIEDGAAAGKKKGKKKGSKKSARSEREVAEQQLELLHFGHRVLREAERPDCAEILEHAAHVLELRLQRREDEQARRVYRTAPKRPAVGECLGLAAEILADGGKEREAGWLTGLAQTWTRKQGKGKTRGAQGVRPRPRGPREKMAYDLEVMHMAKPALLEAEREDLAHQIELAMHWREMWLDGKRDDAMRGARRRAPTIGNTAEIVGHASHLWREFGDSRKAAYLGKVRDGLLEDAGLRARKPRPKEASGDGRDLELLLDRLEQIHAKLRELREQIRDLRK